MGTLLLDTKTWDLVVDVFGNIAVADAPYSLAQDAASAIRLFKGELWYDTTKGVPQSQILGQSPPLALIKAKYVDAALTVSGVVAARVFISSISSRSVQGQVQVTDVDGNITTAGF